MAEPAIFAELGDAFEQGQAAMEVERLLARPDPPRRRHRLGDRAAAGGTGRTVHDRQPHGCRRLQEHQGPGCRLGVRQVPGEPGGPGAADAAEGLAARVDKEVLAGPYATSFDGSQGLRRQPRLRQAQAVVRGLQRVDDDAPGGAGRKRVQRPEQDGAKEALETVAPQLDELLAERGPVTDRSPAARSQPGAADPARRGGRAGSARDAGGPGCSSPRRCWGSRVLSAGPILATLGDQPHVLGPADPAEFVGLDNFGDTAARTTGSGWRCATRSSTRWSRCPLGMALGARARLGPRPADPRHRHHPDRCTSCRS